MTINYFKSLSFPKGHRRRAFIRFSRAAICCSVVFIILFCLAFPTDPKQFSLVMVNEKAGVDDFLGGLRLEKENEDDARSLQNVKKIFEEFAKNKTSSDFSMATALNVYEFIYYNGMEAYCAHSKPNPEPYKITSSPLNCLGMSSPYVINEEYLENYSQISHDEITWLNGNWSSIKNKLSVRHLGMRLPSDVHQQFLELDKFLPNFIKYATHGAISGCLLGLGGADLMFLFSKVELWIDSILAALVDLLYAGLIPFIIILEWVIWGFNYDKTSQLNSTINYAYTGMESILGQGFTVSAKYMLIITLLLFIANFSSIFDKSSCSTSKGDIQHNEDIQLGIITASGANDEQKETNPETSRVDSEPSLTAVNDEFVDEKSELEAKSPYVEV